MRVSLDSNILVYAAQRDDPKHPAAAIFLRRALAGDCVQTLQSLGECYNVLRRKRGFEPSLARQIVRHYRGMFQHMIAASLVDFDAALGANEAHGLPFWDAMIWATTKRAACKLILSEDFQDGRELEGVMFVNPFTPANARLLDLALPKLKEPN